MKKIIILTALLNLIFEWNVFAQNNAWCGSMDAINKKIAASTDYKETWDGFLGDLQNSQSLLPSGRATTNKIFIPVVFHIVHNGDPIGTFENITDEQALSQIDALNKAFNFQDTDIDSVPSVFKPLIANCQIQFCIARFDENGNPTTGITRHQYAKVSWDTYNDIDNVLKPATIWDPEHYLNIWVINMGGGLNADGVLAYATIPFGQIGSDDGVVTRYTNIGTTSNVSANFRKGKTVVHEVGHWLGLLHIWGLDAGCNDFGDFIDDTPDQADLNFGCPTFPHVSCNNGPNGDMFMNYMDYTDQNCSAMFTLDQAARMTSTLTTGLRSSIPSSIGSCFYDIDASVFEIMLPADTICNLNFMPLVRLKNEGATILTSGKFYLQIDGGNTQIVNWNGWLDTRDETVIALPVQNVSSGNHSISVTFGDVNGLGADNYSPNDQKTVAFYAYDGGSSASLPFIESFEGVFPPNNWTIENPNNDITWTLTSGFGGYGTSSNSISINNLGYTTNPNKKRDAFVTGSFDFSSTLYPELTFDLSYARFGTTRNDTLFLSYSLDCGSTWNQIWQQGGTQLATAPNQTTLFTPADSQWKTIHIPLVYLNSQNNVSFKFENQTGWGNRLFIDNINIQNNQSLNITEDKTFEVKIFPNPTSSLVGIRLDGDHPFRLMEVYNSLGQLVDKTTITQSSLILDASEWQTGIHFLHFYGERVSQVKKLIVQH